MKLYLAGLGLRGDGYPNAARTVLLLERQADIEIVDCGRWLPEDLHLWKLAHIPRWQAIRWVLVLLFGNLRSLIRVHAQIRIEAAPVYVPYPGVFFLFWLSLLPRRWRPQCIVDAYISIWDSLYRDRTAAKLRSIGSRVLKWLETRALRAATMVLVDTEANRDVFTVEFGLDPDRVRSIPLAIDEDRFSAAPASEIPRTDGRIRILFVGTLIPLHGISVVLDAFARLAGEARFEFRLIGNGQQADRVSDFIAAHPGTSMTWIREWCSLERIATEIAAADICIGVFGGEGKAARVLPFKLYMYFASGRAVISQAALSRPQGVPFPPIANISEPLAEGLADAIRRLAADASRRDQMGREAAAYYQRWLANSCVTTDWRGILGRLDPLSRRSDIV